MIIFYINEPHIPKERQEQFDAVKKFILEQETLGRNKEIGAEIVEYENKIFVLRQKFVEEINRLIKQAENGTTLKGNCQLCPKIKIQS
jgi:hypothetical protein